MNSAIQVADPVTLPIQDSEQSFPVQNIYCVGRNYADHAIEMGSDPSREAPFFFMKPGYAILPEGGSVQYPPLSNDVHHEVELVVALKKGGVNLTPSQAEACIYGYGVGLDLTRRDLQGAAKKSARPWDSGKVFKHAAPCSAILPLDSLPNALDQGNIQLFVNGEERQQGNLNQMIWKVPEILSNLSELFPLYAGDLIFTGTPAGVGPVEIGDNLLALIENVGALRVEITR